MSLSDYISIFDTRPIAQSHLFEAATATLCAIYTSIYTTRTNAYAPRIATKHVQRMYAVRRAARQARHTRLRHATPRRFAGPHLMLPAGSADADANSDAATAAARCLYPNCTHVRVYAYIVDYETRAMRILLNILSAPTCATDERRSTPVGRQKLALALIFRKHWKKYVEKRPFKFRFHYAGELVI